MNAFFIPDWKVYLFKPKIYSFLFYTSSQKKYNRLSKEMNEKIEILKYELKNGGFYAYSI